MKFTHRITWNIGLNRGAVPYPAAEAIEAASEQLARRGIDGFTILQGVGYWQGSPEACLVVSVMLDGDNPPPAWSMENHAAAYAIAADLAQILGQDAVAWSIDPLTAGGLAFAS